MSKRKPVEIIEDASSPQALIIGGGIICRYLKDALTEYGCQVIIQERESFTKSQYDYIFQFDDLPILNQVIAKYLKKEGKFLLVKTSESEAIEIIPPPQAIILKVGELNLWNRHELIKKILKTMFSRSTSRIIDVSRGVPFKKEKPFSSMPILKKKTSEINPKPQDKKTEKIIPSSLPRKTVYKKKLIFAGFLFMFLLLILSLGIFWYISSVKKIYASFKTHFAQNDFISLSQDLSKAEGKLKLAKEVYDVTYQIIFPFQKSPLVSETGDFLAVTDNLLNTSESLIALAKDKKLWFSSFSAKTYQQKIRDLSSAIFATQKKIETTNLPFFPRDDFLSFLTGFADKITSIEKLLPVFEQLLITDKVTSYLILFQNNMELRPTGGFIGSFALLTSEKGKIHEFRILDVYDADGQLKGHVEPPGPIRKYLSQPNFFLRDSNFDPDFAASAQLATFFLEKELGITVDGVIGVNLFLIQKILSLLGPVTIADFNNEVITSDNFFFKAQSFIQKDFFPGSSQKKDFLKAVAVALENKITGGNLPVFDLLSGVTEALERKDILLYVSDSVLQALIEKQGWGGRMVEVNCSTQPATESLPLEKDVCFSDYLSIIEANLGINKANYFISKTVTLEKRIEKDGKIITIVTLAYENKNLPEIFPGGTYNNYLRFFVPKDSRLISLTLNNAPIALPEVETEVYGKDKIAFGYLLKVAPSNKAIIKLTYELNSSFANYTSSYQFFYQKQGGDKTSPLLISLIFPEEFRLTPLNFKSGTTQDKEIFYATDTSVDRIFAFERVK